MRVELKPIHSKQDIAALSPLLKTIWREVFPPIIGSAQTEYMLLNYQSPEDIEREITDGARYYFVEADGQPIGYLAYEIREHDLFISKIYLLNSERGKGISSQLFDWLEGLALDAGRNRLHLHVNRDNLKAIKVYQHKGFSVVQSAVSDIGGGFVMDDYYMEKLL